MAVSKLWSVTNNLTKVINYAANPEKTAADNFTEEQYQALRDVLTYAKNEEKTELEFLLRALTVIPQRRESNLSQLKKLMEKRTAYKPITDI